MSEYYDPDGKPLTLQEWSAMFGRRHTDEDDSWWRKQSKVDEASISTVWLGLDHGRGSGRPIIYETMIFGGDHDEDQWRYATREEAHAHHDALVAALKAGESELPDPVEYASSSHQGTQDA